jgi:hypothetical protein
LVAVSVPAELFSVSATKVLEVTSNSSLATVMTMVCARLAAQSQTSGVVIEEVCIL